MHSVGLLELSHYEGEAVNVTAGLWTMPGFPLETELTPLGVESRVMIDADIYARIDWQRNLANKRNVSRRINMNNLFQLFSVYCDFWRDNNSRMLRQTLSRYPALCPAHFVCRHFMH